MGSFTIQTEGEPVRIVPNRGRAYPFGIEVDDSGLSSVPHVDISGHNVILHEGEQYTLYGPGGKSCVITAHGAKYVDEIKAELVARATSPSCIVFLMVAEGS